MLLQIEIFGIVLMAFGFGHSSLKSLVNCMMHISSCIDLDKLSSVEQVDVCLSANARDH